MDDLRRRIEEFFEDYESQEELDGYMTVDFLSDAVSLLSEAHSFLELENY